MNHITENEYWNNILTHRHQSMYVKHAIYFHCVKCAVNKVDKTCGLWPVYDGRACDSDCICIS